MKDIDNKTLQSNASVLNKKIEEGMRKIREYQESIIRKEQDCEERIEEIESK